MISRFGTSKPSTRRSRLQPVHTEAGDDNKPVPDLPASISKKRPLDLLPADKDDENVGKKTNYLLYLTSPNLAVRRFSVLPPKQKLRFIGVAVLGMLFLYWMLREPPFIPPKYASQDEADFRRYRFPSVQKRVKWYMTNWYVPPCEVEGHVQYRYQGDRQGRSNYTSYAITELQSESGARRVLDMSSQVRIGYISYLDEAQLAACAAGSWSIRFYCSDSLSSMMSAARDIRFWSNERNELPNSPPIFLQFSDETLSQTNDMVGNVVTYPRVPHIKKIRLALSKKEVAAMTEQTCVPGGRRPAPRSAPDGELQGIVWRLNVERHYGVQLRKVQKRDRLWEEKKAAAVFRGMLNGQAYADDASDEENCYFLDRCKLVYLYTNSSIVDAKLTATHDRIPTFFRGVNLTGDTLYQEEIMAYKGIIILEGNDVASGLKWAMLSNSVVLMPKPKIVSWAMEDMLEPWIHYIPLDDDLTDVEIKVQWMIRHSEEARRISRRASLWIMDLVYHPDAAADEAEINREILRRYRAHFRPASS